MRQGSGLLYLAKKVILSGLKRNVQLLNPQMKIPLL